MFSVSQKKVKYSLILLIYGIYLDNRTKRSHASRVPLLHWILNCRNEDSEVREVRRDNKQEIIGLEVGP